MFLLGGETQTNCEAQIKTSVPAYMCSPECLLYQSGELLEGGAACVWLQSVCVHTQNAARSPGRSIIFAEWGDLE